MNYVLREYKTPIPDNKQWLQSWHHSCLGIELYTGDAFLADPPHGTEQEAHMEVAETGASYKTKDQINSHHVGPGQKTTGWFKLVDKKYYSHCVLVTFKFICVSLI